MPEPEANPAIAEIWPRPFGIFEIRQCPPSPDVGKVGAALRFDENSAVFHEAETAGEIEDFSLRDIWIEIEPQRAKRGNIRDRGERDEIADPRIGLEPLVIDRPSVDGRFEANVFAYRYDLGAHGNLARKAPVTSKAHCLSCEPKPVDRKHGRKPRGPPENQERDRASDARRTQRYLLLPTQRGLRSGLRLPRGSKLFVVPLMVEALSHGVALRRPSRLSLAAASEEAVRAVLAYLHS